MTQEFLNNPKNRSIFITGEIEERLAENAICKLLELDSQSSEPITVYINSKGGSLPSALAIYDALRTVDSSIVTISVGYSGSAALMLMLAGDERLSYENSVFFYHETVLSKTDIKSPESSEATAEGYKIFNEKYNGIIKERTNIPMLEWQNNFKGRTVKFFDSEKALSLGFIHAIIGYALKDNSKLKENLYG